MAAIKEQAAELIHFSASDFYLPIYPEVCQRLAELAPIEGRARTYLGNSGAEVVEASIKLARYATHRPYVVAFLGAFHGRTYGAVSLTASKAKYHAGFGPLLPGVFHAPYGRVEDLRWFDEVLFDKLAPAERGRGDHRRAGPGRGRLHRPRGRLPAGPAPDLRRARDPADRRRDPVGRRSDRHACGPIEHWGVKPDILLTAKGIASGMPLGAMVARAELLERWGPGAHGSTYGGNPVACAAALATIDLLEGGLIANAAERGAQAHGRSPAARRPVRRAGPRRPRLGLMLGVEFDTAEHAEEVQWACFERGLLVLECGKSSVRMSPALTVSRGRDGDRAAALRARPSADVAGHEAEVLAEVAEAGALHEVEAAG